MLWVGWFGFNGGSAGRCQSGCSNGDARHPYLCGNCSNVVCSNRIFRQKIGDCTCCSNRYGSRTRCNYTRIGICRSRRRVGDWCDHRSDFIFRCSVNQATTEIGRLARCLSGSRCSRHRRYDPDRHFCIGQLRDIQWAGYGQFNWRTNFCTTHRGWVATVVYTVVVTYIVFKVTGALVGGLRVSPRVKCRDWTFQLMMNAGTTSDYFPHEIVRIQLTRLIPLSGLGQLASVARPAFF